MAALAGKMFVCGETSPCSHPQGFCQGSGLESVCRSCKDYLQTCFTEYHNPDCTSVCNEPRTSSDAVTMPTPTASSLPTGAMVGIVVGSIVFVIILIYGLTRYIRKRRNTRTQRIHGDAEGRTDLPTTQAPLLENANGQPPETVSGQPPGTANGHMPETANGHNTELREPRGELSVSDQSTSDHAVVFTPVETATAEDVSDPSDKTVHELLIQTLKKEVV